MGDNSAASPNVDILIDGKQVMSGASLGLAVAPADGRDPDQLLKYADLALYRAKGDGRFCGWCARC